MQWMTGNERSSELATESTNCFGNVDSGMFVIGFDVMVFVVCFRFLRSVANFKKREVYVILNLDPYTN